MLIRSKAPLRIGLAGGGTDVSPYSDIYGGAVLNATINLFAVTTIEPTDNGYIEITLGNHYLSKTYRSEKELPIEKPFELVTGVYNHIVKKFDLPALSFRIHSYIEVPQGSGLGTSSTLVVSILGAFAEWLKLPLGKYDIAHMAYEIERIDLNMSGGKQDQYAATFGGINFMEFYKDDKVIVNPLEIKPEIKRELELCLLLYFTDTQRLSSEIINEQIKNVQTNNTTSVEAMHHLKEQASMMKDYLLKGHLDKLGELLHFGWINKKQMAHNISNNLIDAIYDTAVKAGATGGKISGAGGGGFMFFYCPKTSKLQVAEALMKFGGKIQPFQFTSDGLITWEIN
ncbi:MAG: dehydrogenase [Bacteroidetes bacterium]|nr:MAG: dehydrogenase [Bacteroidota bacterium]